MKPVQLITANMLHEAADALDSAPLSSRESWSEKLLEHLLFKIAHDAAPAVIQRALEAAGAPSTTAAIQAQLQAVRDARRDMGVGVGVKDQGATP